MVPSVLESLVVAGNSFQMVGTEPSEGV